MKFQLSQRADHIVNDIYQWVQFNRAIINARDEPLADYRKYRRLHLLTICDVDTMQVRRGIDVFLPARAQVVNDADLVASATYLKSLAFVKPKIGIVGFCWGGGNSLMGVINSNDIVACVSFYGPVPQNVDDVQKLNGPVQGNYGEQDTFVTPGVAGTSGGGAGAGRGGPIA